MNKKAEFRKRLKIKCGLLVLVVDALLLGPGPQASAKKALATQCSRLTVQLYNAKVTSHVLDPSRTWLTLGPILGVGLTKPGYSAVPGSPRTNRTVTIHVYHYAKISSKALMKAEEVASGIFRKAGVETRWFNRDLSSETKKGNSTDQESFHPSDIFLNLLTRSMAENYGLPVGKMGFVPSSGTNRHEVYVFYDRAEQLARQDMQARQEQVLKGVSERHAQITELLGHVIAHEVGHLLGLDLHSPTGIMRADWNSRDLKDATNGYLLFTPQQAEIIRAEVRRRIEQQASVHRDDTSPRLEPSESAAQSIW